MSEVAVLIPTYKRPQMLKRALAAVESQRVDTSVSILVADNDCDRREGQAVVDSLIKSGYRVPISAFLVPERGISHVRNALIAKALEIENLHFIAFMDDDQTPDEEWLAELLAMQRKTGAEVVSSAIYPAFEVQPPGWLAQCRAFNRDVTTNGTSDSLFSTGGVLLALTLTRRMPLPWFDSAYNATGGEDTDFAARLKRRGTSFARARDAHIEEFYPASRSTPGWALARAYRTGNSTMAAYRRLRIWSWILRDALKIPAVLVAAPVVALLSAGRPARRFDMFLRCATALGRLTGLVGLNYKEYLRTHGR